MDNQVRKNSRAGIASFLIAIGTPLLIVSLFIFSIPLDTFLNGYQRQNLNFTLGLAVIFVPPLSHLIGLILGIVGVRRAKGKKVFSILGIILNGLFLLLGIVLVVMIILIMFAALGRVP